MSYTARLTLPILAVFAALTLLIAGGASRQPLTTGEIVEQTIDKLETSFDKSKAKIIAVGEKTVGQINFGQMRMTPEVKLQKTAAAAKKNIASLLKTGKKTLDTTAASAIKTLTKRQASEEEKATVNNTRDALKDELDAVAQDCYTAIDTALAD